MAGPVAAGSYLHVITPGDHFSPSTGSAIPTVVHGLSAATPPGRPRSRVAVATGTYPDRYPSADVVEYRQRPPHRLDRYADAVAARAGLPRRGARRVLSATLTDQRDWPPSVVLAHNMPQLVDLVDTDRHAAVLYAHNELFRTYSPREAGRALSRVGAVVCVSDFLAGRTADRLPPALRERLVVVHNGVDTALFHPDVEAGPGGAGRRTAELPARGDRDDRLHVVFVGRTVREKGPDLLVDALVRLGRPDIRATVVGAFGFAPDGPLTDYERDLRRAAAPLGHAVTWLPFQGRQEVARLLRGADVVVVPSRWPEPFALVALEGMASGAATVAARTGGIPEAVGDAGLLVPPGDPVALAEALDGLADDRSLLARLRTAARAHAVAHDWSVARRTLDRHLETHGLTRPAG